MKRIVEYKSHGGEIPYFISDGGYFRDATNKNKLIGLTKDDSCCFIPVATLTVLSNQDLIDRLVAQTLVSPEGVELTTEEKTSIANDWLSERGL